MLAVSSSHGFIVSLPVLDFLGLTCAVTRGVPLFWLPREENKAHQQSKRQEKARSASRLPNKTRPQSINKYNATSKRRRREFKQ